MDRLISPETLKKQIPLNFTSQNFIESTRHTIRQILTGEDLRLLLIVGPCSIHDCQAAKEYAHYLKELAGQVSSKFFIVMRVYFEKPRTTVGWKGMINDPFLDDSSDIQTGLYWARQLLIDLAEMQVPAATEFLDPILSPYFSDLISWGCIGARTVSSQIHRQLASGLPMPMGIKNSPDGNLDSSINALITSSQRHTFVGINEQGQSSIIHTLGNRDVHLVLRGGENNPNYDSVSIHLALERIEWTGLRKIILIDCSHDNSKKKYENQLLVFKSVLQQVIDGNNFIRGLLLESHLFSGSQTIITTPEKLLYGVSITDSCLDWVSTKELILSSYKKLLDHQETIQNAPEYELHL